MYNGPEQFHIVFISWVCHARSFARCVKLVQEILSTFEYVKIDWLLDNWIIRNCRFLMICLIICIFFFVYALWKNSDSLSSVEISSTIMIFDLYSYVEHTCDKSFFTRNSFDLIFYVEQTCDIRVCFVPVIYFITG